MDVLVHLAANPERVVSKEELLTVVWGGAFVEEGALAQAIHSLRKALGDDARQPRFIQTVPKRGYRLVAAVEPAQERLETEEASLNASTLRQTPTARWNARPRLLAALAALLVALVLWIANARQADPMADHGIRIVVLPFENIGEPVDPYFAAGLTEEITANLTLLPSMQVIPGRNALGDKGVIKPLPKIAEELRVDYVLMGSVSWVGEQVRVRPKLIRVEDETSVQISPLMVDARTPFTAQQEISRAVISTLDITLTPQQSQAVGERFTVNAEAYRAYVSGRVFKDQPSYSPAYLEKAALMFQQATEMDPEFAEAWAELSQVHSYLAFNTDRSNKRKELARHALDRAVALAPELFATRLAQAYFSYRCMENYRLALEQLAAAAGIAPNSPEVLEMRGLLLRRTGNLPEAIKMLQRAWALNPRKADLVETIAETYRAMRDHEEADKYFEQAIGLSPDVQFFYEQRALNRLCLTGSPSEARAILEASPLPESHQVQFVAFHLDLYEHKYDQALKRLSLEQIKELPASDQSELAAMSAIVQERLGNHQGALELSSRNLSRLKLYMDQYPRDPIYRAYRAVALAQLGRTDEARSEIGMAVRLSRHDAFSGPHVVEVQAMVYMILGRSQEAISQLSWLLTNSYRAAVCAQELRLDPFWDPLREDPGFEVLLRRFEQ
jgi:serine/threonine-protein kinase